MVNYSKEQVANCIFVMFFKMMPIVTVMIIIMLLSKVSKLLEEGRLREGVVLVNYRLILRIMTSDGDGMMEMEIMLMMLAFCETSDTHRCDCN